MNKKLISKITTISLVSLLIASCTDSKQRSQTEAKVITNLLKTASSDPIEKQMDKDDLNGCPILIKNVWDGYGHKNGAGVDQTWLRGTWYSERGIGLDSRPQYKSYVIQKSKISKLIYVGKWQRVEKIGKNIRLISAQFDDPKEKSGGIRNYYESMDEQNKKIPEMPLKLIKPTYGDDICILKWHAKYGYNAIAENYRQLRPGFWNWLFRNHELIITGKIVEAKE